MKATLVAKLRKEITYIKLKLKDNLIAKEKEWKTH